MLTIPKAGEDGEKKKRQLDHAYVFGVTEK